MNLNGNFSAQVEDLKKRWATEARWQGVTRRYSAEEVISLRTSVKIEHSLAKHGAEKLWDLLQTEPYVNTFGVVTGNQAVQMAKAGLKAIYLSGWQVAGDNNSADETYPDQSLYPADSAPKLVKRINNAFMRADQVERLDGKDGSHMYLPIVADAEAGFGGPLNAFELMKAMLVAGAAGVHFEDQLASAKKCGHMGGKVLVPTSAFINTLQAARLAADVMDVPALLVARTDSQDATLLTSDIDDVDRQYTTGERTAEGFYGVRNGIDVAITRSLAYAPYADMVWCETKTPDLADAKKFAEAIHAQFPGKLLAYNCSPSFNWKRNLDDATIAKFQREMGAMGYKFQFITLAGWHMINFHAFDLAKAYKERGMSAYVELQEREFAAEAVGYTAARHQREVGAGYFDQVLLSATGGATSTAALVGSTEEEQFQH